MVVAVTAEPSEIVQVTREWLTLPRGAPDRWIRGAVLRQIQTLGPGRGTPAPGAVDAASITVSYRGSVLRAGKDYLVDPEWGSLGRPAGARVAGPGRVAVSYRYALRRLDSWVGCDRVPDRIVKGVSHLTTPQPPTIRDGQRRIANIFIDYFGKGADADIFPVSEQPNQAGTRSTPGRLPATMAKLGAGRPVRVVCWGDSVTEGGDASSPEAAYPALLRRRLQLKFPQARLEVQVVAVGASNSRQWLYPNRFRHETRQDECDWLRIVRAQPDLVTIEFVNDAGLGTAAWDETYRDILGRLGAIGAEVVLITPHFTWPPLMEFQGWRSPECRPYVGFLFKFAEEHRLAVADASSRWAHLWREGVPYITLLRNGINHPDDRGHAIFADELLKCFET